MPRITRVTTKTGDTGETRLGSRQRVAKDDPRVEAYGTIDELNSAIGLALALGADERTVQILRRIQNELLDVGADLAMPSHEHEDRSRRIGELDVLGLERDLATLLNELPPLANFVLPGGLTTAAAVHVARTVCRRAERRVVTLARTEDVNPQVVRYLNRLSDLLFVIARMQNRTRGHPEPVWEPRETLRRLDGSRDLSKRASTRGIERRTLTSGWSSVATTLRPRVRPACG